MYKYLIGLLIHISIHFNIKQRSELKSTFHFLLNSVGNFQKNKKTMEENILTDLAELNITE